MLYLKKVLIKKGCKNNNSKKVEKEKEEEEKLHWRKIAKLSDIDFALSEDSEQCREDERHTHTHCSEAKKCARLNMIRRRRRRRRRKR